MKRVVALAMGAVLVLGACGGGDDGDAAPAATTGTTPAGATTTTAGSPTTTAAADITEADLHAAILSIDDLPAGWAEAPADDDDDDWSLCDSSLADVLDYDEGDEPKIEATFAQDPQDGPVLFETLGTVPPGKGPEMVPALQQIFQDCTSDEHDGVKYTITKMSFPAQGESSLAVRVALSADDGSSASYDYVFVQGGDVGMIVGAGASYGDVTDLLTEWVPKAWAKAQAGLL